MKRPFLTAEWRNLFLASYAVPPPLLLPYLPRGLDLDTRHGNAFVSLVAFEFVNTRVLGVPWPGFRNLPEPTIHAIKSHIMLAPRHLAGESGLDQECTLDHARHISYQFCLARFVPHA